MTSSTQNRTLEIEHSKTKQSRVLSRPNALLDAVTTHAGLDHTAPVAVRTHAVRRREIPYRRWYDDGWLEGQPGGSRDLSLQRPIDQAFISDLIDRSIDRTTGQRTMVDSVCLLVLASSFGVARRKLVARVPGSAGPGGYMCTFHFPAARLTPMACALLPLQASETAGTMRKTRTSSTAHTHTWGGCGSGNGDQLGLGASESVWAR
jgi:hypothetical protein